jgi:arylsulfatase A-like enzyme
VGRNILFVTTDQQRYDSLGCNGGQVARTPVADRLAAEGINYRRAYNQNTVCTPARSTMLTGQYVRTHGARANGIGLPEEAPSIAGYLREAAGYRTALLGKAHFEPAFDMEGRFEENRRWRRGDTGDWRGFDTSIQAAHVGAYMGTAIQHYGRWLEANHPEWLESFAPLLGAVPGGDTGAPETFNNPIPREIYHTDWLADLAIGHFDTLTDGDDWFMWLSFPDPHHPWDPPASELGRVRWQDLDLPPGHPGSNERIAEVLAQKPAHWLACWEGTYVNQEGGPFVYRPQALTHDNIREVNAKVHVMNELIDEALGRVLDHLRGKGWLDDTDVFFTTDHGEMQGDYGFLYKGPFHTESLMRLPMIWRPAASAGVRPGVVTDPVGQLDLAPTFCHIAGVPVPDWIEGAALPVADGEGVHERALCEWDSQFPSYGMHLRTIVRDGFLCTAYEKSTGGQPNGLEQNAFAQRMFGDALLTPIPIQYEGTEGELYDLEADPHQFVNLWDDPARRSLRDDLVADLYDSLPKEINRRPVEAVA